jgi:uncharacterized membrane protein YhhN
MKSKILPVIYSIVLAAECLAILSGSPVLHVIAKPLLMPVLLAWAYLETRKLDRIGNLILAALFFSWAGDVVLLIDSRYGSFFIYGLVAFLGAHICYIVYFNRVRKLNAVNGFKPFSSLLVVAYMTIFYLTIYPFLGALKIPVLIYAAVITLMLLASIHAFSLRIQKFGVISVAGTLIFAVSDSTLAINRFVLPFAYAPFLIMLTYGVAQFLIVGGSIRNLRTVNAPPRTLNAQART